MYSVAEASVFFDAIAFKIPVSTAMTSSYKIFIGSRLTIRSRRYIKLRDIPSVSLLLNESCNLANRSETVVFCRRRSKRQNRENGNNYEVDMIY